MKGIYLLVLEVERDIDAQIGALGEVHFESGKYFYVGSAQNGIEQRVERHRSSDKKLFWHIDYLLNSDFVEIVDVIKKRGSADLECRIAERLLDRGEAVKGFGCSDCKCMSHLIKNPSSFNPNSIF